MANITTQTIRVDLSTDKVIPSAFTHQNDTARTLEFSMYNKGVPYDMTGNTVKFAYKSPIVDGAYTVITGSGMASGTVSGNKVTVTLPSEYTAISGVGMLTMIITPTSGTVRPVNIRLVVQKSADGDDTIMGASDFPVSLYEYMDDWLEENEPTEIANIKNSFANYTGAKMLEYSSGYIDCSGSVVNKDTVVSSTGYKHLVDECVEGDLYIVNGTGASSAKSWCFIDSSGNRLSYQPSSPLAVDMGLLKAPANSAYFISNYRVSQSTNPFAFKIVDSILEREAHISAGYLYAIQIPSNSDLNDYSTAGNYRINSASIAQSISNMPTAVAGRLTVMTVNAAASVFQLYQTSSGIIFWRVYSSGSWESWNQFMSDNDLSERSIALRYTNATEIPENSDLDDYNLVGNYYVSTVAIANTISNMPAKFGGRLTVLTTSGAGTSMQMYATSNGQRYWRNFVAGSWTAWRRMVDLDVLKNYSVASRYTSAIAIPENSDLNDYTTIGNYSVSSVSVAQTISNMPVNYGGRLTVLTLYSVNSVHQWYIASNNDWFVRELINGEWSNWRQFADVDYVNSASTEKSASKGAYNALQAVIKNSTYDIAFANAFTPLTLKNYLGNTQNVHPKVLYFSNGFGGHSYWMAYTPYPFSRDGYENPCIAYSDDGYSWTNISDNPLDDPSGDGYNSDTHLVYRESDNTLECWYRYVGDESLSVREETIYRQTSTDGINWSEKEVLYSNTSGNYAKLLSPAVIIENSKYCIWVVNTNKINYYEAPVSNPQNWTLIREYTISFSDGGTSVNPWHIDVIKDGEQYDILVMCRNTTSVSTAKCSLFITTSSDNVTYTTPVKVVGGADNWDKYMYRSSIVKIGNKYRIYYSAGSGGTSTIYNNAVWGIGITESDTLASGYIGKYE